MDTELYGLQIHSFRNCFMCLSVFLHIFTCTMCACCLRVQKRTSSLLELELEAVVSCSKGCWELTLHHLQEQNMPLTDGTISLASSCEIFKNVVKIFIKYNDLCGYFGDTT